MPPNTAPRPVGQSRTSLEPDETAELAQLLIQQSRSLGPNPSQAENTVREAANDLASTEHEEG